MKVIGQTEHEGIESRAHPVAVVDNDRVGRHEVEAQPACTRRQKEDEHVLVGVEGVDL